MNIILLKKTLLQNGGLLIPLDQEIRFILFQLSKTISYCNN